MIKIQFPILILLLMLFISCNKKNESENRRIILKKFKTWQNEQIKKGKYLDAERCNLSFFADNDYEDIKQLPTIGFPSDSLIKYHFSDINKDDLLDAIVVYDIVSCDGASALNYAQNEIVILSTQNNDYKIIEDFFEKTRNKIGYGNLYIDSLKSDKAYATYQEYLDDDPRCCPSYIKKVEIDMTTKDYSLK